MQEPQSIERRIHHVFVTRNTEYHVRRDTCLAVRDRRSGEWLLGHLAIKQRVHAGLCFEGGAVRANAGTLRVGESLFFHADQRDMVTSPVIAIERPVRETLAIYSALLGEV